MNFSLASIKSSWVKLYSGPLDSFNLYWNAYGRHNALFRSFYFWSSVFIACGLYIANIFSLAPWQWQNDVISVIPTIFGFSLGGFAILVGFGNEEFRKRICDKQKGGNLSIYIKVNASFFHFIFVQFTCLFYTIIIKSLSLESFWLCSIIGIFLFIYSLFTIIAIAFAVLRLAKWFDGLYPPKDD